MFLILTLIIVVAAFNIISSMIMMVKDKGRDIAILRTMGASRGMILRIFMLSGASIGVVGTVAGFVARRRLHRQHRGDPAVHSERSSAPICSRPRSISSPASRRASMPARSPTVVLMALGAVVPGDALPVLARRAARSGRGAALRVSSQRDAPALELRGVRRVFRQAGTELRGAERRRPGAAAGRDRRAGRPVGRRQVDPAACRRAAGAARWRRGADRRASDCGSLSDERRTAAAPPRASASSTSSTTCCRSSRRSKTSCCRR